MAVGHWQYTAIMKADTNFLPVAETDFLILKADSNFRYEIFSAGKKMNGKWRYDNHQLILKYNNPDTTRYFDVDIISEKDFIFTEGDMKFVLKRED